MNLNKVQMSDETFIELDKLVKARLNNIMIELSKRGGQPIEMLLSEIILLEIKQDALMQFIDDRVDVDFSMFDAYILKSIRGGLAKEAHVNQVMTTPPKPPGPILVKP